MNMTILINYSDLLGFQHKVHTSSQRDSELVKIHAWTFSSRIDLTLVGTVYDWLRILFFYHNI